jgi:predicted permease
MGMLGWAIMGLSIWHFTIWLPDRFWGGIVGALIGSLIGAVVAGLIIYGLKSSTFGIPGEKATDVAVVLYSVPGALVGIALVYLFGARREKVASAGEAGLP